MSGISALIGALAFVGGLIFLAGIGLVVVSVSQGRSARQGVVLAVIGLVAFLLLTIVGNGILVVQPARSAVVINVLSGNLEDPPRPAGTSIIIPGIQEYVIYPVDQQEYTMSGIAEEGERTGNDAVEALTVDGQTVWLDITVIYRIADVNQVHLDWQNRYENEFIRPQVRAIIRDIVSQFEAEAIYGVDREALQGRVRERLDDIMANEGLELSSMLIRQIRFNEEFAQSIERKQIEEQELQRARTEAERVRTEARGRAEAAIEEARGEAEAILIRAEADAEALRLISTQIGVNPNLIPYLYVQNLSDNVELALLPSNSPFLFDLDSFQSLGDGFTPPEVPEAVIPEPRESQLDDNDTDGNSNGN